MQATKLVSRVSKLVAKKRSGECYKRAIDHPSLTGQKEESVVLVTSFCLTQLNAQIVPAEVASNAALVQPAALQGDVEGVGHLME